MDQRFSPANAIDWLTALAGRRSVRIVGLALAVLLGWRLAIELRVFAHWIAVSSQGHDFHIYLKAARSWMAGGAFYHPYQLAGPYPIVRDEILYPPPILFILLPFTVLPGILFWAIPAAIIGGLILSWRPGPWGWLAMLFWLAFPFETAYPSDAMRTVNAGNPGMWIAAFVALALRWPWAGPLVLLKPTMAPFALIGIRKRSWWIAFALLAVVSLAMLPLWIDYVRATLNASGGRPFWYTINNVAIIMVPVSAYLARRRRPVAVPSVDEPLDEAAPMAGALEPVGSRLPR
jgi:hypothetical protein